jgi:hypothetical protein
MRDQNVSCVKSRSRWEWLATSTSQADVGKRLRVRVVASNSRGRSDAFFLPTDAVQDAGAGGGIIELPNGEKSVDAKDVPKDQRLVVDQVKFDRNPVTSRSRPI